jgi:hypothetical protein
VWAGIRLGNVTVIVLGVGVFFVQELHVAIQHALSNAHVVFDVVRHDLVAAGRAGAAVFEP